jgi:membrane protein
VNLSYDSEATIAADMGVSWDTLNGCCAERANPCIGKFILGLYLGSGAAGSLISLLLWIYSAQILLFGAEFTQVYAGLYGSHVKPQEHAVMVERREIEVPTNVRRGEPI